MVALYKQTSWGVTKYCHSVPSLDCTAASWETLSSETTLVGALILVLFW